MKSSQTFVKFDSYETEALQKFQRVLSEQEGHELSRQEVIRACVRYAVHDLMGRDFIVGRDAQSYLEGPTAAPDAARRRGGPESA